MAKNDDLILRGKALEDLRDIKEMLVAAGDPFLASVMHRAIICIQNQPAAGKHISTRVAELEAELAAAMKYIQIQKECTTCKHEPIDDLPECRAVQWDCTECDKTTCKCWGCGPKANNWEWRGAHGQ